MYDCPLRQIFLKSDFKLGDKVLVYWCKIFGEDFNFPEGIYLKIPLFLITVAYVVLLPMDNKHGLNKRCSE